MQAGYNENALRFAVKGFSQTVWAYLDHEIPHIIVELATKMGNQEVTNIVARLSKNEKPPSIEGALVFASELEKANYKEEALQVLILVIYLCTNYRCILHICLVLNLKLIFNKYTIWQQASDLWF